MPSSSDPRSLPAPVPDTRHSGCIRVPANLPSDRLHSRQPQLLDGSQPGRLAVYFPLGALGRAGRRANTNCRTNTGKRTRVLVHCRSCLPQCGVVAVLMDIRLLADWIWLVR